MRKKNTCDFKHITINMVEKLSSFSCKVVRKSLFIAKVFTTITIYIALGELFFSSNPNSLRDM